MRLRMLSMFAMFFVLCTGAVLAQTTSGSITGTVVDSQQAAVAGAKVTVTEEGKSYSLTATTDGEGRFAFPIVPPGTYTLSVEAKGFKKQQRKGVTLVANDRLSLGNLDLEVGAVSETVTVTSEATPIQADSGERSFAIQNEQIQAQGLKTRSYINLATLAPGVVANGAGDGNSTSTSTISVNGVRTNSNNVQIDGVTSVDTGNNSELSRIPLDSVGEFKLLTSTYQPEYGRSAGAQFNISTQSGSKLFHGSAYFYRRQSGLNANSFDNNRNNRIRAISDQKDKGYRIGGPVYIPGVFNKDKKKLFFFVNQEWTPRITTNGLNRIRVPTALERLGDFSQTIDQNGNLYPYIKNSALVNATNLCQATPATPTPGINYQGACFADGGVLGRIPTTGPQGGSTYAIGLKILSLYPLPNHTQAAGENFNYIDQFSDDTKERNDTVRLDYNISEKWRVNGRMLKNNQRAFSPYGGLGFILGGNIGQWGWQNKFPRNSFAFTVDGTINSTTTVEFTYGFSKNVLDGKPGNDQYTIAASGLQSLPLLFPSATQGNSLPQFGYAGNGRLTATPSYRNGNGPFVNFSRTDDFSGTVSKIWGDHITKFGGVYQLGRKDQTNRVQFNGGISFSSDNNNPFDTSFGFANAAIGTYQNYTQASAGTNGQYRYIDLDGFVQDNWRVNKRLTLDYGVRFSWMPPTYDASGKASNFDPSLYRLSAAPRLYVPVCINGAASCTGGSQTGVNSNRRAVDPALLASGVPLTLANTFLDTIFVGRIVPGSGNVANGLVVPGKYLTKNQGVQVSPRVGFAFDVTRKHELIIRGGFGMFYDRFQGNLVYDYNENPPTTTTNILDYGFLQTVSASVVNSTLNPPSIRAIEQNAKIPSTYAYNLGVQYRLPYDIVLDAAYVGSMGHHLPHTRPINETPFGSASLAANQDPTKGVSTATQLAEGRNAYIANLYRPFKGFGSINMVEFNENSNYNSLQISATRRFSKGLLLSANYTLSRANGISTGDQDTARFDGNTQINYGRLGFDRTHNFNFNWVYEIPNRSKNRYLSYLTKGWQVAGVYRFQSGEPELVSCGISGYNTTNLTGSSGGGISPRCVLIGDPNSKEGLTEFRQFNVSAFKAPSVGSTGTETNRNDLLVNAPPINNWDLSISKKIFVRENMRVEARLDAFNALNHTQGAFFNFFGANYAAPGSTTVLNPATPTSNLTGYGAISGFRPNRTLQWMLRFEF